VLPNGTTALLTIASFNYYWWSNLQEFKTFIDQSFQEIEAQGITDLIIDVRYNGGGSQHASIHLLKYLMRQPFQYFSSALYDEDEGIQEPFKNAYGGKLYFMIDGNGNSTTGHFMSLVKAHDLGVIIGEELGSNQFCTGGSTTCRLTNTQLEFYVATGTHITTATGLPDETGILPDHTIPQTIDAYLKRVDPVKDFTLGLIAE
jgi:C-terminal processing protease CtpA/Prc